MPASSDLRKENVDNMPPAQVDINLDDDDGVSEVNLDDDDDIFKSARLEPEPAKTGLTNGFNSSRAASEEPIETDIPLEDDEHP